MARPAVVVMVALLGCRPPEALPRETPGAPEDAPVGLVAGDSHACARWGDGTAVCWGDNRSGQLGTGDPFPTDGPVDIALPGGVADIDAAGDGTCAVDGEHRLWCWGLLPGWKAPQLVPRVLDDAGPVARVWMDPRGGCALSAAGEAAWCWGDGKALRDTLAADAPFGDAPVAEISGDGSFACARAGDGRVACREPREWRTALRDAVDLDADIGFGCALTRGAALLCGGGDGEWHQRVAVARGADRVAVGYRFQCVSGTGGVWCRGDNQWGQLGQPGWSRTRPVDPGLRGVVDLVAGARHTCALDGDGVVWCWGANGRRQVDASGADVTVPRVVGDLPPVVDIEAEGDATCARTASGEVWCWGDGEAPARKAASVTATGVGCAVEGGRVRCWNGLGDPGLADAYAVRVWGGDACAFHGEGAVTCWSRAGRARRVDLPTAVVGLDLREVRGSKAVYAWDGGGRTWVWSPGYEWDARSEEAPLPWPVAELGFGDSRACARSAAGVVRCLELGQPDVDLPGIREAAQLAVGREHLCLRTTGGEVRCLFDDDRGQLGDALQAVRGSDELVPVRIVRELAGGAG